MKWQIGVLTATRAEYGILKPLIKKMSIDDDINLKLLVSGAHLSDKFGNTYREIEEDKIDIFAKIPIQDEADTSLGISRTMGTALAKFGEFFSKNQLDALVVLGDRYETVAVCLSAMAFNVPIIHLHGGETTQGVIDEAIRHAITKLSYLHFTSTKEHRNRVIQLGEQPDRVFNVGALGVENVLNIKLLSKKELEKSIDFSLDKPIAVVTYHPVTLEKRSVVEQSKALLDACKEHVEMNYIFTKANADLDGSIINGMIDDFEKDRRNVVVFTSLGMLRYMSALKYAAMVIGNSSSGIIEAPSFGIPTINIGDRQKGRMQSKSIINALPNKESISQAINKVKSAKFIHIAKKSNNPYEGENTSKQILDTIKIELNKGVQLKKEFYDL